MTLAPVHDTRGHCSFHQSLAKVRQARRERPTRLWQLNSLSPKSYLPSDLPRRASVILRPMQRATAMPAARIRGRRAAMSHSAFDASLLLFGNRADESDAILDAVGILELRRKAMRIGDIRALRQGEEGWHTAQEAFICI